nr:MAG TPA: radical SAM peptide maturase, CXXX-repeat target family [Caudoviricetes sp.]
MKKHRQYQDYIAHLYGGDTDLLEHEFLTRNITFQVTDDCTACCTYCYQGHKGHRMMTKDVAKRGVDLIFDMYDRNDGTFINHKTKAIILDFIGGEPLMNIDIIDYVCTYFMEQCVKRNHPWIYTWRASMISNGSLYFNPKVQAFLKKFRGFVSFGITLDGPKEIHNSCRVYHDGRGNFDDAYAAMKHFNSHYYKESGTKVTIAPENLHNLNKIVQFFVDEGMEDINANTVFEAEWTEDQAKEFYVELKKMANYLIELNNEDIDVSLFVEDSFRPLSEEDNSNYCWGKGTPILTSKGYKPIEYIKIGDLVYTHTGELKPVINTMHHFDENVCTIKVSGAYELTCTKNHRLFTRPFDYRGFKGVKHYKDDCIKEVQDIGRRDLLFLYKNNFGNVNYEKNLCYLIGRFVGDGYTTTQNGKSIICAVDETNELKSYFENANIEYSIYEKRETNEFHIIKSSKNENNILFNEIVSQCGKRAENKCVPENIWSWDKESVSAFIDGYMAADGYIKNNDQYVCNTVSYRLANEIMVLLRSLGYSVTCYKCCRAGESYILGRKVNTKDRYEVYFRKNLKKSKFVKNTENECTTHWLTMKDTEPQEVYNITVADNHSYIAGGLLSSNCGGNMAMLAFDPDGVAYPCLRFMESSLGNDAPPIIVGTVDGIFDTEEHKCTADCLSCITRRSQSTDECWNCPIGMGCAWCSAWNYQLYGTPDKRCTRICPMHKARSLANVYYWNTYYRKHNIDKRFEMHLPKEEALKFITEDEYNMLLELSTK